MGLRLEFLQKSGAFIFNTWSVIKLKEPICPPYRYCRYVRITLLPVQIVNKHKVDNKEEKRWVDHDGKSPFSYPNLTNDTLKERQEDLTFRRPKNRFPYHHPIFQFLAVKMKEPYFGTHLYGYFIHNLYKGKAIIK